MAERSRFFPQRVPAMLDYQLRRSRPTSGPGDRRVRAERHTPVRSPRSAFASRAFCPGSTVSVPSRCSIVTGLHMGQALVRGNKRGLYEGGNRERG